MAANGLISYGASQFPTQVSRSSNYWVDVLFTPGGSSATNPTVLAVTPSSLAGASPVLSSAGITVQFNEGVLASTINSSTFVLTNSSGTVVPATVTYNGSTYTATLTPSSTLASSANYTATVTTGITDSAGHALPAPYSWSFTAPVCS